MRNTFSKEEVEFLNLYIMNGVEKLTTKLEEIQNPNIPYYPEDKRTIEFMIESLLHAKELLSA